MDLVQLWSSKPLLSQIRPNLKALETLLRPEVSQKTKSTILGPLEATVKTIMVTCEFHRL